MPVVKKDCIILIFRTIIKKCMCVCIVSKKLVIDSPKNLVII